MYNYKECGLGNVRLINGYKIHESPYGRSVSIDDIKGLHKVIGFELTGKAGALSGEEIRFIRKEMGLSQKILAQTVSVAEITIRGWESGKARISGPADKLLRVLYRNYSEPGSMARELVDQLSRLDSQIQTSVKQFKFEVADKSWIRKKAG